jgi:TolB protein
MRKPIEQAPASAGAALALVGVLVAVAVVLGSAATAARMTAPGKNGRIAFRRYLGPHMTRGRIFTIGADGRHERRVTLPANAEYDQPDWSPDGSRIAFRRERGGDGAIYTVRADGSGLTRISDPCRSSCEENYTPAFAPDGKAIVFASFDERSTWSIVVAAQDGRKTRIVSLPRSRAAFDGPQFSPDRKKIIFERINHSGSRPKGGRAIFLMNADGSGMKQVTPWKLLGGDNPDWSPNGKWILFHSNVESKKQSQLYLIHSDGSGLKRLTHFKQGTIVTSSSFSPDGKWIVLGASGVGGNADLYVMRANGGGMRPLTRTRLWDSAPDWGPAP